MCTFFKIIRSPAAQTDTTIFRPKARMAFGLTPFSGEDFWNDDEEFKDDYDVYTKEPGELPIGDIPWVLMIVCCVVACVYTRNKALFAEKKLAFDSCPIHG